MVYDPKARSKSKKEELTRDYEAIIGFNEILTELAEETEFEVISNLTKLKKLIDEYVKTYM